MLYRVIWILLTFSFPFYFRKIFLLGKEHRSRKKPVIIACNHPNTFMDALLIGLNFPKPVHFLVRADVFNTPLKRALLKASNQIPIYRFRDGFKNLHRNRNTFEACFTLLKRQSAILMFAEGDSENEWRVRPLKKGVARLAFEAVVDHGITDLEIQPSAVHYNSFRKFRNEVSVQYAPAIRVADYLPLYEENPNAAVRQLTLDLQETMRSLTVHIPELGNIDAMEKVFEAACYPRAPLLPLRSADPAWLERQRLAGAHWQDLTEQANAIPAKTVSRNPLHLILMAIGLPVFVVGFLGSILPAVVAKKIYLSTAGGTIFEGAVNIVVRTFIFIIYWILLLLGTWLLAPTWAVGLAVSLPLWTWLALAWLDLLGRRGTDQDWLKKALPDAA